jgi:protein-S-isoprenylcysteine O-methyltransferase Ste14
MSDGGFRWITLAIVVSAFAMSAYYRRRARIRGGTIERRREEGLVIAVRVLVAAPLAAALLTYLLNPAWMEWASLPLPPWSRWIGVGLGVSSIPMVRWVFRSIGDNISETVLTKANHALVTHGPYRWVRHPLYATGLLLLVAIGLTARSAFLLAFAAVAGLLLRWFVIPREEEALIARFGAEYRAYQCETGRLVPKL